MNLSKSLKSYIGSFPFKMILRKLEIVLEGGHARRGVKETRHNATAPRKIIILSSLTPSHLLNYSFVDSNSLCMHGILLKQFIFRFALGPDACLRDDIFVFEFLIW